MRQGTHQVAHRFSSTVRPRQSESFFGLPLPSSKARSGICSGFVAMVRAATSPCASGAIFLRQRYRGAADGIAACIAPDPPIPYTPANPITAPIRTAPIAMRNPARGGRAGRGRFGHIVCHPVSDTAMQGRLQPAGAGVSQRYAARQAAIHEQQVMSNKMWGGRFTERPDAIMEEINVSIDVDRHLYAQDIAASKAHAAMLSAQGIITANDAKNIGRGLDTILSEIGKGSFDFKRALEDIHMNVESRLGELIGPASGRLHTARSRNDQVATDFRLYVRDTIDETDAALAAFQHALVARALEHAGTVMPGFTHLQTAQPVTFGHHLLAYVEMAARDRGRFADARKRLEQIAARRRGAGRHVVSDRSRRDREGARLRPADGQFARCGLGSRLRARNAVGGGDRIGAPVAFRRGDRDLDLAAGGAGAVERQIHHRLLDHAAEAQSRRRRTGSRQDRPGDRRADRAC